MTKTALAVGLLAAIALLAPGASAHGAAAEREVDTRVLADQDGLLGYAGCLEGLCLPPEGLGAGALDLLALDVRELSDANGTALLAFRTIAQANVEQQAGRSLSISFTVGGQAKTLTLTGDGLTYASSDVDRAFVSTDTIGDGHAKAIEAWVALARLGAKPGDALTDLRVATFAGTTKGDLMPGTWHSASAQDEPVPFIPGEPPGGPDDLAAGEPGAYTLKGPAKLLEATADRASLDTSHSAAKLTVTVKNPLATLPQFVTLSAAGADLRVAVEPATVNLDPGASKTVTLTVRGPTATLNVTAASDLGGHANLSVPVVNTHGATSSNSTTTTTATTTESTKKSPGLSLAPLALGLAAVALARRRW